MECNDWGFRPPSCTCRLNWTRKTSWWRDEWEDTALQTQNSKLEHWGEAERATSLSWRLLTLFNIYEWAEKKHFVSLKLERGSNMRSTTFQVGRFNHGTRSLAFLPSKHMYNILYNVIPTSSTLGRRCMDVMQKFCVYWVGYKGKIQMMNMPCTRGRFLHDTAGQDLFNLIGSVGLGEW